MLYSPLKPWQRLLAVLCGMVVLGIAWDAALRLNIAPRLLLPPPKQVLHALIRLLNGPAFWAALGSTVWTWAAGVVAGALIGAGAGILLGLNRYIWAATEPWVEFTRALPSVVLVPLVSLFLGVGSSSRLVCTTTVVAVLMVSTAGTALRSAALAHQKLAYAWRASNLQTIYYFMLPAALSHMIVALKAAIPIALIVAVAADMLIATDSGIGKVILDSVAVFDTPTMYAAVLVVGILGYGAAVVGTLIERITVHWSGR